MTLERVAGQPTWLLSRAHARAQELLGAAFGAAGVRGYHYRLLAALAQFGPSSQAGLGRHTGIDRSDVVAALTELDGRGWTRRQPDAQDRRRNVVTLTAKGRRKLEELDHVLAEVQAQVLAPLSPREREAIVRLLAKLADADRPSAP